MNDAIRAAIARFADDLSRLVREAALEAARSALSTPAAANDSNAPGKAKRRTRAGGPSAPNRDLTSQILDRLSNAPALRTEQIGAQLGVDTTLIKPILRRLVADGTLRKTGERRGAAYSIV